MASIQKASLVIVASAPRALALEVTNAIRAVATAPILVLTHLEPADRIELLKAGADLVLGTGLEYAELSAQIDALLRRSSETWEPTIRFLSAGNLHVDLWARTCTVGDELVNLSRSEFQLLEFLMRHPRQALAGAKIVQRVWGGTYSTDLNALHIRISRLRRKLAAASSTAPPIRSVRGVGYEFAESVVEMGDRDVDEAARLPSLALGERLLAAGRAMPIDSISDAAEFLAQELVRFGGCDAAAIFQRKQRHLELVAQQGNSAAWRAAMGRGVPLGANYAQAHAIATKQPTQVGDIQVSPQRYAGTASLLAEDGFRSCLFVPIVIDDESWGGLGLASRSTRPFDPVVTTFCMAMAALFGTAIRATLRP
jgi:DNA-binding response OmpR family regulator/putative methionine-R-sulfoxide reductase with GAF domain